MTNHDAALVGLESLLEFLQTLLIHLEEQLAPPPPPPTWMDRLRRLVTGRSLAETYRRTACRVIRYRVGRMTAGLRERVLADLEANAEALSQPFVPPNGATDPCGEGSEPHDEPALDRDGRNAGPKHGDPLAWGMPIPSAAWLPHRREVAEVGDATRAGVAAESPCPSEMDAARGRWLDVNAGISDRGSACSARSGATLDDCARDASGGDGPSPNRNASTHALFAPGGRLREPGNSGTRLHTRMPPVQRVRWREARGPDHPRKWRSTKVNPAGLSTSILLQHCNKNPPHSGPGRRNARSGSRGGVRELKLSGRCYTLSVCLR